MARLLALKTRPLLPGLGSSSTILRPVAFLPAVDAGQIGLRARWRLSSSPTELGGGSPPSLRCSRFPGKLSPRFELAFHEGHDRFRFMVLLQEGQDLSLIRLILRFLFFTFCFCEELDGLVAAPHVPHHLTILQNVLLQRFVAGV